MAPLIQHNSFHLYSRIVYFNLQTTNNWNTALDWRSTSSSTWRKKRPHECRCISCMFDPQGRMFGGTNRVYFLGLKPSGKENRLVPANACQIVYFCSVIKFVPHFRGADSFAQLVPFWPSILPFVHVPRLSSVFGQRRVDFWVDNGGKGKVFSSTWTPPFQLHKHQQKQK